MPGTVDWRSLEVGVLLHAGASRPVGLGSSISRWWLKLGF